MSFIFQKLVEYVYVCNVVKLKLGLQIVLVNIQDDKVIPLVDKE